MKLEALTSAIYNNVIGGLKGENQNIPFSMDQIEDAVINERLLIIKEYSLKNIIPRKDLLLPVRCLELDCSSVERCCNDPNEGERVKHFEIPQLILDFGVDAIEYAGPQDGSSNFKVYISNAWRYHKHKIRGQNKPYIWIDVVPNTNNKYDCFLFNQPFMTSISFVGIFKDPRQLKVYSCCSELEYDNFSFLSAEIEKRVTQKFLYYFRQVAPTPTPNDQIVKP